MPPFRPSNLNIRKYPGNANVIGPLTQATLGVSTTTCQTCTPICASCQFYPLTLGARCSYCACPCCQCVVGCECTVCTKKVPGGMWRIDQQYQASLQNAWGSGSTSSNTLANFCCFIGNSITCIANITDYYGNLYSGSVGGSGMIASPYRADPVCGWDNRGVIPGCNPGGSGWFVPSCGDLNLLACCKGYATFPKNGFFWSDTEYDANKAWGRYMYAAAAETKTKSYRKVGVAIRNV